MERTVEHAHTMWHHLTYCPKRLNTSWFSPVASLREQSRTLDCGAIHLLMSQDDNATYQSFNPSGEGCQPFFH
jgi:hypothetical protein